MIGAEGESLEDVTHKVQEHADEWSAIEGNIKLALKAVKDVDKAERDRKAHMDQQGGRVSALRKAEKA
jgi:hypothetical protein